MKWESLRLAEIIIENSKSKIKVRDSSEIGAYPFFTSGDKIKRLDEFLCKGENIFVATGGKANFKYFNGKASYSTDCYSIKTNEKVIVKYLYYFLVMNKEIINNKMFRGAALKHLQKKEFKDIEISIPSLAEQQRIVAKLDAVFAKIDSAIHTSLRSRNKLKVLSFRKAKKIFGVLQDKEPMHPIGDVCEAVFAGGDAPKDSLSDVKEGKFQVPIYANAMKNKGLYGYTEFARVHKPSVTVAGRGSGTGYTEIRYEPFLPIVRLIVLTPDESDITVEFLKHAIVNLEVLSTGSAIPQLTVPMIKSYEIPVPRLNEQQAITEKLDSMQEYVEACIAIYTEKLKLLASLKSAILVKELHPSEAA